MVEEGETHMQNGSPGRTEAKKKPDCKVKIVLYFLYFVPKEWRPLELLGGSLSTGATAGWVMGAKSCDIEMT